MENLWQDLRYSLRMLVKYPGFTLIAALVLGLAIGASTSVFSVVNMLLLRPPSGVEKPDQLVMMGWTTEKTGFNGAPNYPDYIYFREQNTTLSDLAIYGSAQLHLSTKAQAERISGALVSGNYFTVLGVKAAKGRLLLPEDDIAPGANQVAVISYRLWNRHFGANPDIVGTPVSLNGYTYDIIGVAAENFAGARVSELFDIWIPISMYEQAEPQSFGPENPLTSRSLYWLDLAVGRLKPNVTVEQAQAEMSILASNLEQSFPKSNKGVGVSLLPGIGLQPHQRTELRQLTGLLMATVGLVLLIACANIANLLLARGSDRQKEFSIRLALGASRARLFRQLLTENLLLALLGGTIGILFAFWGTDLLSETSIPLTKGPPVELRLEVDTRVLAFTLFVSIATGLIFGVLPALKSSKVEIMQVLKIATGSGARRARLRSALVVGQIALSLVVLICAGLLIRSLQNINAISPGFNTDKVLVASLDVGRQGYSEAQAQVFYKQLIERIETRPGVRSVSLARIVPLGTGFISRSVRAEGQAADVPPLDVTQNIVSPRYFETMEIPLLMGRDFNSEDDKSSPGAVIINETLARRLFPNENPLGKRLAFMRGKDQSPYLEIVGIVQDAKYKSLLETPQPHLYVSWLQQYQSTMTLHVLVEGDPSGLVATVRQEVQGSDKNLPVYKDMTLAKQLRNSIMPQQLVAELIGIFGFLALLLASIGLYGLMAYSVTQRTQEIGIRMALGAQKEDVLRLIINHSLVLMLLGLAIGLSASFFLNRFLSSSLYGVSATDPATFIVISLILTGVALLASWIPARRAMSIDPTAALRCE